MDNCIFCKIAAKQIPSKLVYEDDELLAFHDIHPAAPMHLLIIPRLHIPTLADCDECHAALLGRMNLLASRLAKEQGCGYQVDDQGIASGGYKTMFHIGPDGGQQVYHLHLHVIGGAHPWREQH